METIINYLSEEFIKKLVELQKELYKDPKALADFVIDVRNTTDDLARRFVQEMIQELDETICSLPVRKQNWYIERRNDPKRMTTSVGDIEFSKTLYVSKNERDENGKPISCYLLDKVIGFVPNQTMTEDAVANVYKEAVQTSYRKGGEMASPNGITKGAVKNILHNTKFPLNFRVPMRKKVVDYLYIEADEDHYHLQFQNKKGDLERSENGRKLNGAITKIIYVHEGIRREAPKSKRHMLINTHYFCRGEDVSNAELWKEVFDYIDATYDVSQIEKIYMGSDGGGWIKAGYRGIARITYVLDEFHLSKCISRMIRHMKDSKADAREEIYESILRGTKSEFLEIAERLKWCTKSEAVQNRITEAATYIANNWTAARLRLEKSTGVVACSAEGHVYHVLSSRMSTQAMGWSRHGAAQMAHLREYYYNGGDMLKLAKFQKEELPMAAGAEDVVLSAQDIFLSENTNRGKDLKEYGKYSDAMSHTLVKNYDRRIKYSIRKRIIDII